MKFTDHEPQRHRDTETQWFTMYDGLHAALSDRIIGCAIEVHRHLGPGLFESIYESALCVELTSDNLAFKRQIGIRSITKGFCSRNIDPIWWYVMPS